MQETIFSIFFSPSRASNFTTQHISHYESFFFFFANLRQWLFILYDERKRFPKKMRCLAMFFPSFARFLHDEASLCCVCNLFPIRMVVAAKNGPKRYFRDKGQCSMLRWITSMNASRSIDESSLHIMFMHSGLRSFSRSPSCSIFPRIVFAFFSVV